MSILDRSLRRLTLCAALAGAAGCSLADTTIPVGEDVLIVEAVLRTDLGQQRMLLHRSAAGEVNPGETGATITVRDVATGIATPYQEGGDCYRVDPLYLEEDSLDFRGTCYESLRTDRWVQPGATYELEVLTRRGERVRGRTSVPQPFTLGIPFVDSQPLAGQARCVLAPGQTLSVEWTRAVGAWSYLSDIRVHGLRAALQDLGIEDAPDPMELRGLAISAEDTSIVLPTEYGVFERFRYDQDVLLAIQDGFPPDVQVQMVTAAADRNFVNGVRGGAFNPSGQVRISSVVGDGVGVFGSLVPLHAVIVVRAGPSALPRCDP